MQLSSAEIQDLTDLLSSITDLTPCLTNLLQRLSSSQPSSQSKESISTDLGSHGDDNIHVLSSVAVTDKH